MTEIAFANRVRAAVIDGAVQSRNGFDLLLLADAAVKQAGSALGRAVLEALGFAVLREAANLRGTRGESLKDEATRVRRAMDVTSNPILARIPLNPYATSVEQITTATKLLILEQSPRYQYQAMFGR